ncbi:MAG: hypothetical protein ACK4Q5_08825 [Saprospiraceae bacterium]
MKQIDMFALTCVLAISLASCSDEPELCTLSVQGKLTNRKTGEPIVGNGIQLYVAQTYPQRNGPSITVYEEVWTTTDSTGHYFMEYDGIRGSSYLVPGSAIDGYGGFKRMTLSACQENTVDVAVYPYDSFLKIMGENDRKDTVFTGIKILSGDENFAFNIWKGAPFVEYYFDKPIETGQTGQIDSIPICGGLKYVIIRGVSPGYWLPPDTIFCPEGTTVLELKI